MTPYIHGIIVFLAIMGLAVGAKAMLRRTPRGWIKPPCPPAMLPPMPIPPVPPRPRFQFKAHALHPPAVRDAVYANASDTMSRNADDGPYVGRCVGVSADGNVWVEIDESGEPTLDIRWEFVYLDGERIL